MRRLILVLTLAVLLSPAAALSDSRVGIGPLTDISLADIKSALPPDTHVLIGRKEIESFLNALEKAPPDWAAVYGHGHHDPGHDERLFNLNRERDAARKGNPVLQWRVAFVWMGQLSRFDFEDSGYPVSIGPEFTQTGWGMVRFKAEDMPANLRAVPIRKLRAPIRVRMANQEKIEVAVVFVGTLIPEESIVYDFSHDEEGLGLIMPVVRVEHTLYVLK